MIIQTLIFFSVIGFMWTLHKNACFQNSCHVFSMYNLCRSTFTPQIRWKFVDMIIVFNFRLCFVSFSGKIYIHCQSGVSRSASIVLAFLLLKRSMRLMDAVRAVREKRKILPNDGFISQLIALEETLDNPESSALWQEHFGQSSWNVLPSYTWLYTCVCIVIIALCYHYVI